MNSTLRQLAPFLIAICVVAYWYYDRRQTRVNSTEVIEEEYEESTPTYDNANRTRSQEDNEEIELDDSEPPSTPAAEPYPMTGQAPSEEAIRQRYTQSLREMTACLGLQPIGGEPADPNVESWVNSMRGELGEPVLQTEDSSSVDIQTSSGERRRILIEMDYSGEERIVRRVKYFKLNGDQPGEAIPLAQEQAEDPSETFLASLEGDGQVTGREKNERVYFASGEEIVVTEQNGRVSNIEVNRNGRSFRCRPTDVNAPKCECVQ